MDRKTIHSEAFNENGKNFCFSSVLKNLILNGGFITFIMYNFL